MKRLTNIFSGIPDEQRKVRLCQRGLLGRVWFCCDVLCGQRGTNLWFCHSSRRQPILRLCLSFRWKRDSGIKFRPSPCFWFSKRLSRSFSWYVSSS